MKKLVLSIITARSSGPSSPRRTDQAGGQRLLLCRGRRRFTGNSVSPPTPASSSVVTGCWWWIPSSPPRRGALSRRYPQGDQQADQVRGQHPHPPRPCPGNYVFYKLGATMISHEADRIIWPKRRINPHQCRQLRSEAGGNGRYRNQPP